MSIYLMIHLHLSIYLDNIFYQAFIIVYYFAIPYLYYTSALVSLYDTLVNTTQGYFSLYVDNHLILCMCVCACVCVCMYVFVYVCTNVLLRDTILIYITVCYIYSDSYTELILH